MQPNSDRILNPSDLFSYFKDDPRTREISGKLLPFPFPDSPAHQFTSSPVENSEAAKLRSSEIDDPQQIKKSTTQQINKSQIHLKGLVGSSRAFVSAAIYDTAPFLHFFILPDKESAAYFYNDLEQIFEEKELETARKQVLFFPSSLKHSSAENKDNQGLLSRTEVLNRLHPFEKKFIIVTHPEALAEKVVNRKYLDKNTLKLKVDEMVSHDFILDLLIDYEFERADFVAEPGQFSIRGGIIDVYSFSDDHPFRIEFEGDRVASIRAFDPASQLSLDRKTEITIIPDIRITRERRIEADSLFAFIPEDAVVWIDDMTYTLDIIEKQGDPDIFLDQKDFLKALKKHPVIEFGKRSYFKKADTINYNQSPQPSFNKNFDLLIEDLKQNTDKGFRNILLCDNPKQKDRLFSIIEDIQGKKEGQAPIEYSSLHYSLHEGFIEKDLKLACFTDHQIFERYHRFRLKDGYTTKEAMTMRRDQRAPAGDFVTHIDHGIGRFDGLEKIVNNGHEQEAIRLIYKNSDILYVSIHSLHRIAKYIGKDGTAPVLHRLGSDVWKNLKNKTKKRVKDIAKDLIKLYAERRATEGFAYAPDSYMQTELEASFIYEDTPDQLKATVDVKNDLEATFPMDG